ncbi:MAG: hypothetical protein ABI549_12975 [Flavobacterium sp.]|uniref:hypothetical protein n=1 Tax=Flavobacterium sp. TaxID=239 RepID=UPI00326557E2
MKRRLFLKKASIATTGILLFSGSEVYSENIVVKKSSIIDFLPISISAKKVTLKGLIVDCQTLQPIKDSQISIKMKNNRMFSTNKDVVSQEGEYEVINGFTASGKVHKKMYVEIKAEGYKPYEGMIFVTPTGCNLHSNEWAYNKNFDPINCPKNTNEGNETLTRFNFHLVKN